MATLTTLLEAAVLIALVGVWMVFFALMGFERLMSYASASAAAPATIAFVHSMFLLLGLPTTPAATATASVILPVTAVVIMQRRSDASLQAVTATVVAVGVPALLAVAVVSRLVRFERATPDTLLYLAHARLLRNNSSLFLESADLAERGLGVSSYHSLASLFDNDLFAAMQLNIGVASCAVIFATSRYLVGRTYSQRVATLASITGTALITATDRFIFSHQLIGQHGLVGLQLGAILLMIVAIDIVPPQFRPTAILTLALIASSVATARPEGVLIVAFMLFLVAISGLTALGTHKHDVPISVAALVVINLPWTILLWLHGPPDQAIGTLVIPFALTAAKPVRAALQFWSDNERTTQRRYVTKATFVLYFGLLFLWSLRDPLRDVGLISRSVGAIAQNLLQFGGWGVTFLFLPLLLTLADSRREPFLALLKDLLLGLAALTLGLAVVRNGAYRVGPGDSFNRILYHSLPLLGVFFSIFVASLLAKAVPRSSSCSPDKIH